MTIKHLPTNNKDDLLTCRQVRNRLSQVATPFAVNHITMDTRDGFSRLIDLSNSPVCRQIKEISWRYDGFDTQLAGCYRSFAQWLFQHQDTNWDRQAGTLFDGYQKSMNLQMSFLQDLSDISRLAAALGRFTNLKSMTIDQCWSYELGGTLLSPHGTETKNPFGHQIFNCLVSAIAMNNIDSTPESLDLRFFPSSPEKVSGPLSMIQDIPTPTIPQYLKAFDKLKELEIRMPWCDVTSDEWVNFDNLVAHICSAKQIQDLSLIRYDPYMLTIPGHFLDSICTPQLTRLTLIGMSFQSSDLFQFLDKHKQTLRFLTLHSIELGDCPWCVALQGLRDNLALDSCSLDNILDNEYHYDLGDSFYQAAERFVLKTAVENPYYSPNSYSDLNSDLGSD